MGKGLVPAPEAVPDVQAADQRAGSDHVKDTDVGKKAAPSPEVIREIQAVVQRAKKGDASVLPRLRVLLAEFPDLAGRYGDLAAQAQVAWAALAAGPDLYLRECLLVQAETMRAELSGPAPSPVERLLVERVVACWMQMYYFDSVEAPAIDAGESPRLALYRAKRQEQAHRAYLTALAALVTLRKLLPAPVVEIVAAPQKDSATRPDRNGDGVNGHPTKSDPALPPCIQDRLAGLFDHADGGDPPRSPGRKRAAVAADN